MIDLGKQNPGSTVVVPFHTFDSNDPSASVAIAAFIVGDIEIYRNGDITAAAERGSDSGVALIDTDGIDLDGIVGIGGATIDLSDNDDAGFWQAGSQYTVIIGPVTVDAAVVNFIPVTFRIGYDGAFRETVIESVTSQTVLVLPAGVAPPDDNAFNGCRAIIHDVATADQWAFVDIIDYDAGDRTVTLAAGAIFTVVATDNISFFPPALHAARATVLDDWINDGRLDAILDAIPTTPMRGTDSVVLAGPTKTEMDNAHALLATPAQVSTQAVAANVTHGLDHLISAAVADEVVDDSVIAKMVDRSSTADWSSFIHTEDSLRALSEEISAIGSASGGGFNFAPVGSNALEDQIDDGQPAVDKGTSPETVGIPVTGHAFLAGHEVTITGTANYSGSNPYVIDSVTTNEVVIVAAFVSETFSSTDDIDSSIKGTVIEGVETSGTFASVSGQDGVYHVIDDDGGNNFTIAYRFEVGGDRIATEAVFTGYQNGGNDNALIQAYDFVGDAWETRHQMDGQAGNVNQTVVVPLLARNTGTSGVDFGVVFLRITDGASSSNPTLNVDSFLTEAVGIGQTAGYQNGQIWLDTVGGVDSAEKFVDGTTDRPVKTLANVVSLVAAGLSPDVHVLNGSSVTLDVTVDNYSFFGNNWTLALGGQSMADAHIEGATLSGTHTGTGATLDRCAIGAVTTADDTHFSNCSLAGTLTLVAGNIFMSQCHHAGGLVDFNSVGGATLHAHGYRGNIEFQNMATSDVVLIGGSGAIISNANNADGTINIRGAWRVTDNGSAAIVLDDIATDVNAILVDTGTDGVLLAATATSAQLVDDVWDEELTGVAHNDTNSSGKRLRQLSENVQIEGTVVDAGASTTAFETDLTAVDNFYNDSLIVFIDGDLEGQTRPIKTSEQTNGKITLDEVTTSAVANGVSFLILVDHVHPISQIQDAILTTALTEAYSTDGSTATLSQLLYMIYGIIGEFSVSGTTVTVKKLDGSTGAMTFTLDSATEPTSITRAS